METWCFLGSLFSLPHNKADVYVCASSKTKERLIRLVSMMLEYVKNRFLFLYFQIEDDVVCCISGPTYCIHKQSLSVCGCYVAEWIYACIAPHCSNHSRNFFCKCFFKKWPPIAILDVQKSLCIAFLTISDKYENFIYFYFCEFFVQNGYWRPFWMSENHFRSHFWPFQINTKILFILFLQNGQRRGAHFGCPKFTFDRISGHFTSIRTVFDVISALCAQKVIRIFVKKILKFS